MRVLVTGATGFVGAAVCSRLVARGDEVVASARRPVVGGARHGAKPGAVEWVHVGEVGRDTDWQKALAGVEAVVHLAARVHVMKETATDALLAFRRVNVEGTVRLAQAAAEAGVRRFVYVSSIKVNGEGRDAPYRETDAPALEDAYAISKWEAEQGMWRIAQETAGLEVVVLRPPLVYGPGVKANFRRLLDSVARGWPLPLGAIENRRSFLYLGNFVDAIRVCVEHPAAAGQTFLIDDGQPVSTPDLIRALAHAMGRPARLWPVPVGMLKLAGALIGKRAAVQRLTGSLWVDSSLIRARLGWTPLFTLEQGLAASVRAEHGVLSLLRLFVLSMENSRD